MKTTEKIPWKMMRQPENFPCLLCKSGRQATELVSLRQGEYTENHPLCLECAGKPEVELWDITKQG